MKYREELLQRIKAKKGLHRYYMTVRKKRKKANARERLSRNNAQQQKRRKKIIRTHEGSEKQ